MASLERESSEEENDGPLDWTGLEGELSESTLAALRQFVTEKEIEEVPESAEEMISLPKENLGMSQFWWDDASSDQLAKEAIDAAIQTTGKARIVILSAPSVWFAMQRIQRPEGLELDVRLFEYDRRFEQTAGESFVYFNFNDLDTVPSELHGTCDFVISGPPYVSTDCVDKYVRAFELLARDAQTPQAMVIGATLEDHLTGQHDFTVADDFDAGYQSKFCTPMLLYRRHYTPLGGNREHIAEEEPAENNQLLEASRASAQATPAV